MSEIGASRPNPAVPLWRNRVIGVTLLLMAELIALALTYQVFASLDCRDTGFFEFCRSLRTMVVRGMALFAAAAVLIWARPQAFGRLLQAARNGTDGARGWIALHAAGLGLMFLPVVVLGQRDMAPYFMDIALAWVVGGLMATTGALFWIARPADWRALLSALRWVAPVVLLIALLIPDLAVVVLPLWDSPALTQLTFQLVYGLLTLVSTEVTADLGRMAIGLEGFTVLIARECSGVEGVALVSGFTALYAVLFRHSIRPWRFWLVVLPLGIAASWALNVLRIALLILLGARVSPELAVDGFHSYAGWMFFTLLALGMLYAVQATPWLHRTPGGQAARGPALRADWDAARLLPFVAFMLSGVMVSAFFAAPELAYPLRTLIMLAAVAYFWPILRQIDWRPDLTAIGAGAVVGLGWVLIQPEASESGAEIALALSETTAFWAAVWIGARVAGTVLLVPLIEELFFRGYVLARLDRGGLLWRLAALGVSTALFAALHGRWLAAGLAGLIFGLLMLRRGKLADAIWAHAVANAVVAALALSRSDWGLI